NALGDADDKRNLSVNRFQDRIGREGWGHVNYAGVGDVFVERLADRVADRQRRALGGPAALPCRTALAGLNAGRHARAVCGRLLGMESALRAGKALTDHAGRFVDEDSHFARLSRNRSRGSLASSAIWGNRLKRFPTVASLASLPTRD